MLSTLFPPMYCSCNEAYSDYDARLKCDFCNSALLQFGYKYVRKDCNGVSTVRKVASDRKDFKCRFCSEFFAISEAPFALWKNDCVIYRATKLEEDKDNKASKDKEEEANSEHKKLSEDNEKLNAEIKTLREQLKNSYSEEQLRQCAKEAYEHGRAHEKKFSTHSFENILKEADKEVNVKFAEKDKKIRELEEKLGKAEKNIAFMIANANKTKQILEEALKSALSYPNACCYQPNKDVNILDEQFKILTEENRKMKAKIDKDGKEINRLKDSLQKSEDTCQDLQKQVDLYKIEGDGLMKHMAKKNNIIDKLEFELEEIKAFFHDEKIAYLAKLAEAVDEIEKKKAVNGQLNKINMLSIQKIAELQKRNAEVVGELRRLEIDKMMALL